MSECRHPSSRGPTPAMMEDDDWRRICNICGRRFHPTGDEPGLKRMYDHIMETEGPRAADEFAEKNPVEDDS